MLPRPLVIALAVLVAAGWAINLWFYLAYGRSDPQVNLLFGVVIGAVFGLNRVVDVIRRRTGDMLKPAERDPADKGDPS